MNMTFDEKQTNVKTFTIPVRGLEVSDENKVELQNSVQKMADVADSLGFMGPFDEELSLLFNPIV